MKIQTIDAEILFAQNAIANSMNVSEIGAAVAVSELSNFHKTDNYNRKSTTQHFLLKQENWKNGIV